MSYQVIGDLPHQVMAEDSPEFTLELVDDYIKKDFLGTMGGMDPTESTIHQTGDITYYEEETMQVSSVASHLPQEHAFPYPAPRGPPVQTVLEGQFNFTVKVTSNSNKNSKYLFSEALNKVYADVNCDFAVQFGWEPAAESMLVRACVAFAGREHAERRVECCMQHRHAPNVPDNIRLNILRSSRELGTRGVHYHGDPACPDSWYSVLVEFPPGTPRTHAYRFACKNSCSTGINRRAIAIIFTLEDSDGTVYGRQKVDARVCSCPPRDRRKDEETAGVARGRKRAPKPQDCKAKKVKLETLSAGPGDEGLYALPPVQVVGLNVVTAGLDMMIKMMEHGRNLKKDDPQYVQACNISIDNLKATLEQYRRDNNL